MILPVSHALCSRYDDSDRCRYFPHGVDWEHFASASERVPPEAISRLPAPRIGFFGLIYEKLDFSLLKSVADRYPAGSVVMIGPIDHCDPAFAARSNVHFVGQQSYDELPSWIAGLDALMLPYVDDEMIRQSGPLKLRECLATGKPTVSVDVPEVRILQPHVRVASCTAEFLEQMDQALADDSSQRSEQRREAVKNDGWDRRAAQLSGWIDALGDARQPVEITTEPQSSQSSST